MLIYSREVWLHEAREIILFQVINIGPSYYLNYVTLMFPNPSLPATFKCWRDGVKTKEEGRGIRLHTFEQNNSCEQTINFNIVQKA